MATNVYVDAFNLYYGCLKGTPYRWLDLGTLCTRLLPKDPINRIRYFTATVSARPDNPDAPQRQQVYLRALETVPGLSRVGVINPHPPARRSRALQPTFFKQLRTSVLTACQFPPVLTDARGEIHKPARW